MNIDSGRLGFVYVLRSRFMTDPTTGLPLLKIGATRKHPLQRASELSAATGVPEPMEIAYFRDFFDAFLAETLVHNRFINQRTNDLREFFAAPLSEVIAFINSLATSVDYKERLGSQGITGGEYREALIETPWAELFYSFEEREGGVLNAEEQAKCRALRERLQWKR